MEVREVLLSQVLTPVLVLFLALRFKPISRTDASLTALAVACPLTFLWLVGRWHLFTVWMRPVLVLAVLGAIAMCWRRARGLPAYESRGARTWIARAVKFAVVLFIAGRTAEAVAGRVAPGAPVVLRFPLRDGRFHVGQGGSTPAVNYHTTNRTQRYALDIVKVTIWGNRSSRLQPVDLSQYASYGVTVYAPCAGSVTGVETALPDNSVQGRRDQQRPAGNYVLIRCDQTDVDVLMAHLQAGSVRVTKGDSVVPEQVVGAVGNSGNSTEPHLHIHAKRGGRPDTGLEGDGVPMALNGRFLVRNDSVTGR